MKDPGVRALIWRSCAILALAVFLSTSFRAGWNRATTDFPNYYTAAVLVTTSAKLRNYYDWTWFQKEMNYAGIENQLGGYIPQTPLTMLPMTALAALKVQAAKRVWLLANLAFLGATVWLLSRLTSFTASQLVLVAFAGYGSVHANFLLGQYYVFLLFLLVLGFYYLRRRQQERAGFLCGIAFGLKLYGGPLIAYFAVKRNWRLVAAMALTSAGAIGLATVLFGWQDLAYFTGHVLSRALQGETLDPYNSGNGTLPTLLRRAFISEPELNPYPIWNAPVMLFFLQPLLTVLLLAIPLLCVSTSHEEEQDFAWFNVALILASPNTASYTFILLLLPVALLLDKANSVERLVLICCYTLLSFPTSLAWSWLFPKLWLLLILFLLAGRRHLRSMQPQAALGALALATIVAAPLAWHRNQAYRQESGRRWEQIAIQRGAIYSSHPVVLRSGIVYESIGRMHYVLRWLHDGKNQEVAFPGEAVNPIALSPEGPIQFDLVANRKSTRMQLNLFTNKLTRAAFSLRNLKPNPAISPDGHWAVSVTSAAGSLHLWLQKANGGRAILLAGGNCNNFAPAWQLDSKSVVFASDCDRGLGLPALYRAQLDRMQDLP